jgi:heptosyltransferase I
VKHVSNIKSIKLTTEPKRILIVKPSALGDIVHTLPFLYCLRQHFKTAHISWLVVPAFASLLDGHPLLDEVVLFERKRFAGSFRSASAAKGLFNFATSLSRSQYDLVIDLQGLLRSAWITWQTHAPVRVGFEYAREGAPFFYTHRVKTSSHERHAVERYMDVAQALGCEKAGAEQPLIFDFAINQQVRNSISTLIPDGAYAVLLPGTNWATKRWPAKNFAALAQPLWDQFGLRTVIAGGPDVAAMAFENSDPATAKNAYYSVINLAGKTDLKQLAAVLEKADVVIANDSGPMHMAAALGRPLVTLFGPTNAVRTGPYGRPSTVLQLDLMCRPCYQRHCVHQSCMQWISVADVLKQIEVQLGSV